MVRSVSSLLLAVLLIAGVCSGRALAQARVINSPDIFQPSFYSDPQEAIKEARQKIAAGDLDGAVKQLELYVAGHPKEAEPMRFLGDLYYRQGRFEKAEFTYEEILHRYPYDRETHNRLGVVFATENRIDDAIDQFNRALPGTDSVGDLVQMHARKGDLPKYRADMEQQARNQPTDADIQAEVGQIYAALHRPQDALQYYMRALDSDSTSLTALNGLGLAYLDLHAYSEAAKDFQRCLQVDPSNYTCENNLGADFLQDQKYDEAQPVLTRAHALAPERPEALVNFGFLADVHGDWKKAIGYYVEATVVGPYLPEAYVDLGVDYEHQAMYALAEAALLKGVAAAPQDGRLHYLLAVAYSAQGKTTLALDQLKLASQSLDPDVARIAEEETAKLTSNPQATPQRKR